jgi:cytochrome P450
MTEPTTGCPFHAAALPGDGTPLVPSPALASWRDDSPVVALEYEDGHEGLMATRYDISRVILEDPRFSMRPERMPVGPSGHGTVTHGLDAPLDPAARRSEDLNLLFLDGEQHSRLRRAVTARFSVKQARARGPWVAELVAQQLERLRQNGSRADIWLDYARPIAARTHCHVMGVPDSEYDEFLRLFVEPSTAQERYDFVRRLLDMRQADPGEDVISDLLVSESVSREEAEALLHVLLGAGRDSVAYLIATATVALLTHPEQLSRLREEPDLIASAIEEFMRFGAMFVTVFARTALEDVEVAGVSIPADQSVSVSPVAANRDPRHWDRPDEFDISRDAFGHLGFGHGIHSCIGQQLARVEIREAVSQLVAGMPGLRLVHAEQLEPMPFADPVAVYDAGSVIVEWD